MKVKSESEVTQPCPTLSDPMGCSLLGSSVHGIFQAGVLEWGAIAFSRYVLVYIYIFLFSQLTGSIRNYKPIAYLALQSWFLTLSSNKGSRALQGKMAYSRAGNMSKDYLLASESIEEVLKQKHNNGVR